MKPTIDDRRLPQTEKNKIYKKFPNLTIDRCGGKMEKFLKLFFLLERDRREEFR